MRINDHWKLLREELEKVHEGMAIAEYGNTTCGMNVLRGPHVTVMIPISEEEGVSMKSLQAIVNIVDENLCSIRWDNSVEFLKSRDHLFCRLIMDKN